ncbi:pickpocket protein 19-like [Musca autumnalis]|uniref:pickpocket protein 19-like n=1 Tax=Musca autumnalis TaxID=221902 RepID=UPI003CF451A2
MLIMVMRLREEQPLVTVVENAHLPIYTIHFPALAVCPFNKINWLRYGAAEEKYLPKNATQEERDTFYHLLIAMEHMTFSYLMPLNEFVKRRSLPPLLRDIPLYDVAQFMSFRCNELFVWCEFDSSKYDCCKIFIRERTDMGICLVFNSLVSEDSKIIQLTDPTYPWRVRDSGDEAGLSFMLKYNESYVRPKSNTPFRFSLMIKQAQDWSQQLYHNIYPNTHADVMITPILTETSSEARLIRPEIRNCLFWNEKSSKYGRLEGFPYNKLNCLTKCQHRYLMDYCNCSMSLFFPEIREHKKDECRISDLACLHKNWQNFNYLKGPQQDQYMNEIGRGMICDCIENCESLIFLVTVNTQPMPSLPINTSVPEIYVHVYYNRKTLTKYLARLEYTFLDMAAYIGGVFGLFLGASALSFVEILYATIRMLLILVIKKFTSFLRLRQVHIIPKINVIKE